jgi:hypothetical protein
MPLILRRNLDRPLTHDELDGNFIYLDITEWKCASYEKGNWVYIKGADNITALYLCETTHNQNIYPNCQFAEVINNIRIWRPFEGGGGTNEIIINQTGHTFQVMDVVRSTSVENVFTLAQADTPDHADMVGVVSRVIDANNFALTIDGDIYSTNVPNEPIGTYMFLSPTTPGALLNYDPAVAVGDISMPVGEVLIPGLRFIVLHLRGVQIAASGGATSGWTYVTGDTQMLANVSYIVNKSSLCLMTLPPTALVGDSVRLTGMNLGLWRVVQNSNGQIHFGNVNTTVGVSGYLQSTDARDSIELVCVVANNEWNVAGAVGNINIV